MSVVEVLSDKDRREVTLICFIEVTLASIANNTKPKSRRHTQLLAAIEKIKLIDETYDGAFLGSYKEDAEKTLTDIESQLNALIARGD